jgi:hypothetical protein
MANFSIGGSSPSSLLNRGKTPNKLQAAASASTGNQQVKDMLLATNYVQKTGGVETFDTRLADYYRNGKPSTVPQKMYDRVPRAIDPMDAEEPASLRVFGKDRSSSKSGDIELVPPFSKFILESMTEGHAERAQVVETFGTFYLFFYGERPPTYNYTGVLLNTKDINWRQDFQFYYDNYLRGTKCVENNAHLVMTYGGRQVEGFMLNFSTQTDASLEAGVRVSFQLIITNRLATLNHSVDFGVLLNNGQETSDSTITTLLNNIAGAEGSGLAEPATNEAYQQVSKGMAGESSSGAVIA